MSVPGLAARQAALELVQGVTAQQLMISEIIDGAESPLRDLEPGESARALSLARTVLRNLSRLDRVIKTFVNRPPAPKVQNVLRIATCELLIDGIADHAAVDGAVRLVKQSGKTRHQSGFVNAICRRIAADGADILPPAKGEPLPKWIAEPIRDRWGAEVLSAIKSAHALAPQTDLSFKSAADCDALHKQIGGEILPTGSLRLSGPVQITELPGYKDGAWWIQDAGASLPVQMLGDVARQNVLDLCAAPGGKTLQLAATGASVTALDISAPRVKRIEQNLTRTGLKASIITADALKWEPPSQYDAILLDAPCTATGTIRRHPDLPFVKSGKIDTLLTLQRALLDRAFTWLRPGGVLVYCTCSLLPAEGEDQLSAFLSAHEDAGKEVPTALASRLPDGWISSEGMLRTRPDILPEQGHIDGFFAAAIKKLL